LLTDLDFDGRVVLGELFGDVARHCKHGDGEFSRFDRPGLQLLLARNDDVERFVFCGRSVGLLLEYTAAPTRHHENEVGVWRAGNLFAAIDTLELANTPRDRRFDNTV
jgi:hypothetical protein